MSEDLLEALLRAALAEGALDAGSLPRFAEALRARAALVLAERVQPVEERAAAFETESAWRAEVMAGFEEEKRTWQQAHARLAADRDAQVAEVLALKQEREALLHAQRTEMEAARREKDVASAVHDRLLEHHRATLAQVAETLRGLSRDLPWRYRRARAAALELLRRLDEDAR